MLLRTSEFQGNPSTEKLIKAIWRLLTDETTESIFNRPLEGDGPLRTKEHPEGVVLTNRELITDRDEVRQQLLGLIGSVGLLEVDPETKPYRQAKLTAQSVLDFDDPRLRNHHRIVAQGGHNVPASEYQFCREVGQELGKKFDRPTGTTGSGSGIMEAFLLGLKETGVDPRILIGFTELLITINESTNPHVNRLVFFQNMEQRMDAFIRFATLLLIFPGGPGTVEEVLQLLTVILHPKNQDTKVHAHLIERYGGTWMKALESLFRVFLPEIFENGNNPIKIYAGIKPDDYGKIAKEKLTTPPSGEPWNSELFMPLDLYDGIETEDPNQFMEELEGMSLRRNEHTPVTMASNLRQVFSALVNLTVRQQNIAKQWQSQRQKARLNGDPDAIQELIKFIEMLESQGRFYHKGIPTRELIVERY